MKAEDTNTHNSSIDLVNMTQLGDDVSRGNFETFDNRANKILALQKQTSNHLMSIDLDRVNVNAVNTDRSSQKKRIVIDEYIEPS